MTKYVLGLFACVTSSNLVDCQDCVAAFVFQHLRRHRADATLEWAYVFAGGGTLQTMYAARLSPTPARCTAAAMT